MNRIKTILPLLAAVLTLCLAGCNRIEQIKNIQMTSWALESVTPVGLRGLKAELAVGIENPAMQFTLEDIEGVLYYKGTELVVYSADPVTVRPKSTAVYPLHCAAHLGGEFSLLGALALLHDYDLADFTTDIHAKVRLKSGVAKGFTFKDIPIKELVE
ncbi:MAG: hypothetical protein IJ578_09290 [Bacteroidales bacterium]|nr:hypothetical protein [Bacteroidales bacterium]